MQNHVTRIEQRNRGRANGLFISENGFTVKCITSESEKNASFKLRHTIFSKELKWVPMRDNCREIDGYDREATYIGVFDKLQNLAAMVRVIRSNSTFMLEKEFPFLLADHLPRKEHDTVELSRLCVAPEARSVTLTDNFGLHGVSTFLYKGVYHWCLKNKVRYVYLVVEQRVFRLLCAKGFPCKPVGDPVAMPDGVEAVAALLDWREFENANVAKRPNLLEWFSQYRSDLRIMLPPQRVPDSRHRVFS